MRHVRALSERIGPRPAGTLRDRRSARYVVRTFRRLGYRARLQPVPLPTGARTWNVVARWPGAGRARVIIGGHRDTVPGSPGANDNASGVAVVLELARSVAGTPLARGVRLVAFGAEERQPDGSHHLGSALMARRLRREIDAMISVDMVGLRRRLVVAWMGTGDRRTVRRLLAAARRVDVPAEKRVTGDLSDNGPFERSGVPSAFLWSGDEPNHHQPTDVAANVSPTALDRVGEVLLAFLVSRVRLP